MLSMKTRLECSHSYATDETTQLLCGYDGVCDGELYECCLCDKSFADKMRLIEEDKKLKGGDTDDRL